MPGHSRNACQDQIAYFTKGADLADLVIPGKSSGNYLTKSVYSEGKIGVILKSCNNDLCLLSFIYSSFISTKDRRKLENIFILKKPIYNLHYLLLEYKSKVQTLVIS